MVRGAPRRRVRVRVRVRFRFRVRVGVGVRVSTWYAAHLGAERLGTDAPEHGLDLGRGSGHLVHVREDDLLGFGLGLVLRVRVSFRYFVHVRETDLLGGRRAGVRGRLRGKKGPS